MQRLISSSANAFVYGEEIGAHVKALGDWLIGMIANLEQNEEKLESDFTRALAGQLQDWRPGLPPPPRVMLRAALETFFQAPAAIADFGVSIGRPLWGFKWPSYSADHLRLLLALMPRSKVVYVFRRPLDTLKSAKARRFVTSLEEVEGFCRTWAKNFGEVMKMAQDKRFLPLCYEDLCADPPANCRRLEAFTGARGIQLRVFDVRVNTFVGEAAEGRSPTQYIQPQALTADERDLVTTLADPAAALFYGAQRPERASAPSPRRREGGPGRRR